MTVRVHVDDRMPPGMLVEDEARTVVVLCSQDSEQRRAVLLLAAGYVPRGDGWSAEGRASEAVA